MIKIALSACISNERRDRQADTERKQTGRTDQTAWHRRKEEKIMKKSELKRGQK